MRGSVSNNSNIQLIVSGQKRFRTSQSLAGKSETEENVNRSKNMKDVFATFRLGKNKALIKLYPANLY